VDKGAADGPTQETALEGGNGDEAPFEVSGPAGGGSSAAGEGVSGGVVARWKSPHPRRVATS